MNIKFILGTVLLFSQNNFAAINKVKFKPAPNNIIVAVIDTGTDINHKDLKKFIWFNEGESGKDLFGNDKSTNGVDDDDNGFVDDIHGWNFVNNSNDVTDSHGHGTHISGIIKKEFQLHQTTSTLAPLVRLMILKYYNSKGTDAENILNSVKAINYATKMQARIINYSGGGSQAFTKEFKAIENAANKNIIFVAAAGNSKINTDNKKYFPASYDLKNIISVAATDNEGELVEFSNYGENSVDIAAPGKLIYSTAPNNSYAFMSGTSQSTAYVTGVIASELVNNNKHTNTATVLNTLLLESRYNKSLKGKTRFQLAMIR